MQGCFRERTPVPVINSHLVFAFEPDVHSIDEIIRGVRGVEQKPTSFGGDLEGV